MTMIQKSVIVLVVCGLLLACNSAKKQAAAIQIEFGAKPTIVYKTTQDYARYVPVILSADGSEIVSYPGPSDVFFRDTLAYPTPLERGYLLDNRGIGPNVAFLDITYEAYSRLEKGLSADELMAHIQDKAPLVECYDCGSIREVDRLNILIKGKALDKCKNLMMVNAEN